jgi:Double zinc ribbon/FHA domain
MITCPNCGAGNKAGSSVCRMCAVSLEEVADAPTPEMQSAGARKAAAVSPSQLDREEEKMPVEFGIVCPECNTPNEVGWSFCQQCGKRLPKSPTPPSSGELRSARGLTTVPDQQAISGASSARDLKTVAEKSPAGEPSLKTVAEKSPVDDDNIKTVAEKVFQSDDSATTADPGSPAVENKAKVEISPAPANIAEPPSKSDPWAVVPIVSTEVPLRPTAETPAITAANDNQSVQPAQASQPAQPSGPAPESTQHVQSVSGVLCSQCGQTSNVGTTFCANCGAPLNFGRTMVISSEATPSSVRGRLHLVMEGGQPGDVYELGDEATIGRTTGQITFPHDGFMSGRHARIVKRGATYTLTDEGSRNGTFVKIKGEIELEPGDMILVGKQLFRLEV